MGEAKVRQGSVLMHPTKGINARPSECPQCGKDMGVVMLGVNDHAGFCRTCAVLNIGIRNDGKAKCRNCGNNDLEMNLIPDNAKVPELCDQCVERASAMADMVAEGGCYFLCETCKAHGTFHKDTPIAKDVRKQWLIQDKPSESPPGAILTELNCPECQKRKLN